MNILLDRLDIYKPWAHDFFKNIIKPDMRVTYLPVAFHEDWVHNAKEWEEWYGRFVGSHYRMFTEPFTVFGIREEQIDYVNYYKDDTASATDKINRSNLLVFAGGMPDKIMEHLNEMKLMETLEAYKGIILGWSAGSMVQCEDFYISPDEDNPEYKRCKGLKGLKGFAVEVHYEGAPGQIESIERYIAETGNRVYTTCSESAIIVEDNKVTLLGNAGEYIR